MPSDFQSTRCGNRHNSPTSSQKHHTADLHADEENYSDALETQTADGSGPMKVLTNGPHGKAQPSSRPSSSSSGEFGAAFSQDTGDELIARCVVPPSTEKGDEMGELNLLHKPKIARLDEAGSGFKFGGVPKLATAPRQIPHQSCDQSKRLPSSQYESSGVPSTAPQATPGKHGRVLIRPHAANHDLVPVQTASTLPSVSSSIEIGRSSVDQTEAQASDTSSTSQVSWSQTQSQTPSVDQSERSPPSHPKSPPSTKLEQSPAGSNKAETPTVAHAVSACHEDDMVVDSIEALVPDTMIFNRSYTDLTILSLNVELSSCHTKAFTLTAPGQGATPSSSIPQARGSTPGKTSQASGAPPKKRNNKLDGAKVGKSREKTKSGGKSGRAGSSRKTGKEGDARLDIGRAIDLSTPIDKVNFSRASSTADAIPTEEQATVTVDNHRSQSEAISPPRSPEHDVEVEHVTITETTEAVNPEETQKSIAPPNVPSDVIHITHHNGAPSLEGSGPEPEIESEAEFDSQHCDEDDMEVDPKMSQPAALSSQPSPKPSKMSHASEDKPVEISQQEFESASRNDGRSQCPSPSPTIRPLQPRSQPAQADGVLHSVSGRAGITRVIKGVSRTKKSDYVSFLAQQVPPGLHEVFGRLEFAVAEDTRLRRCLMEISDQLLKDKDAEIEEALKSNDNLARQLEDNHAKQAELRGKLEAFGPRAKRLVKFLKGIGNDMASLKTSQSEMYATIDELAAHNTSVVAQETSLHSVEHQQSELQRNLKELRDDTRQAYQSLLLEKKNLQERLGRREGDIVEAKDLIAVLTKRLESPTQEYIGLEKLIKESHDKAIKRIGAVHDLVSSREDEELLILVKKCSEQMESFCRQDQTATDRLGELKSTVESLSSATQKHFKDVKTAQELDRVSEFETRVSGLLEAMKTDIRSQEDLTAKAASLKETITALEEQFRSSEAKLSELNSQLAGHQSEESSLKQRINQLEATNTSLQHEHSSSSTSIQSRLQETTSENSTLQQEVTKTKAEAAAYAAQAEELQRVRDGLQQRLSETENKLSEARHALPDFGPERAKLEEKARQELNECKLRQSRMAQGNQNRYTGEIRQIKAHKDAAEKKLATALSELDPVKSENQLLKEEATSSKNRIDAFVAELEAKAAQIRQLNADSAPEREKNETLQRTITEIQAAQGEAESAAKKRGEEIEKLQEELRSTKKNLTESDAVKKTLEGRLDQAESAAREQEEKHRSEISISRRNNEETGSRLKLAEDNTAKLQAIVDAQARVPQRDSETQTQPQIQDRIQRPGTADSSQEYGLGPTNQELLQIETRTSQAHPRKQLKKVNRNQNIGSQSLRVMQTASSQEPRVEIPQSTVPETQHDDEDMLDNRRPNSHGSSTGYDASAIDKQVLDENGVRDVEESQSQLPKPSQRKYLPTAFEETQSQLDLFSVKETQQRSESSPLTSPRPEHLNYRQIAAEETFANIASQKKAASPRLHGNGAISQGKKRDPLQSTPGIKSGRYLPRQASQKHNQKGSFYEEEDISDPESAPEATPSSSSSQKRLASQRGAADRGGSKRSRSTPGPVAKSSASKGSSKFASTPEGASSSTRHTSIFNQPSSTSTSSSMGASPAQKQRLSKKSRLLMS